MANNSTVETTTQGAAPGPQKLPLKSLFDSFGGPALRLNNSLGAIAIFFFRSFFLIFRIKAIPDVYFISNRILALHDRKIVFEGDPEDFESLDHPFRQELISSLESLGEELTGLYSKRHFKVRYQTDLSQRRPDATYAAAETCWPTAKPSPTPIRRRASWT